jgi:tRNA wybutosine-synthesizing protein 2
MRKFKEFLNEQLKNDLPEELLKLLPSGFQRIGNIIIINLKPELNQYSKKIAEIIMDNLKGIKTVCQGTGISGEKREPRIKVLAGNGTETIHEENGCLYKLDVAKVMFSKGNVKERGRLAKLVKKGETVVDMFAGIGYFSIPIAKTGKPKRIYAIDINPISIHYLKENIRLNHIENVVIPILGDCRKVRLGSIGDRVIMGYLPNTYEYLPFAFQSLKTGGGIIHYHGLAARGEAWDDVISKLEIVGYKHGYELKKITHKRVVKEYAPNIFHIVIDAKFTAKSS